MRDAMMTLPLLPTAALAVMSAAIFTFGLDALEVVIANVSALLNNNSENSEETVEEHRLPFSIRGLRHAHAC